MGNCASAPPASFSSDTSDVRKLVQRLSHGNPRVRAKAAAGIHVNTIKLGPSFCAALVAEGAFAPLCQLLAAHDLEGKVAAAQALKSLHVELDRADDLRAYSHSLIEHLKELALSIKPEVAVVGFEALASCALNQTLVSCAIDSIGSLTDLAQKIRALKNPSATENFCQLLIQLTLQRNTEAQLHVKGLVPALITVLALDPKHTSVTAVERALCGLYNIAHNYTPAASYLSLNYFVSKIPDLLARSNQNSQYSLVCLVNTVQLDQAVMKKLTPPLVALLNVPQDGFTYSSFDDFKTAVVCALHKIAIASKPEEVAWIDEDVAASLLEVGDCTNYDLHNSVVYLLCAVSALPSCSHALQGLTLELMKLLQRDYENQYAAHLIKNMILLYPSGFAQPYVVRTLIDCLELSSNVEAKRRTLACLFRLLQQQPSLAEVVVSCDGHNTLAQLLLQALSGALLSESQQWSAWAAELLHMLAKHPPSRAAAEAAASGIRDHLYSASSLLASTTDGVQTTRRRLIRADAEIERGHNIGADADAGLRGSTNASNLPRTTALRSSARLTSKVFLPPRSPSPAAQPSHLTPTELSPTPSVHVVHSGPSTPTCSKNIREEISIASQLPPMSQTDSRSGQRAAQAKQQSRDKRCRGHVGQLPPSAFTEPELDMVAVDESCAEAGAVDLQVEICAAPVLSGSHPDLAMTNTNPSASIRTSERARRHESDPGQTFARDADLTKAMEAVMESGVPALSADAEISPGQLPPPPQGGYGMKPHQMALELDAMGIMSCPYGVEEAMERAMVRESRPHVLAFLQALRQECDSQFLGV